MKGGGFAVQQNLGRVLGVIDYDAFPACLPDALRCLLECVGASVGIHLILFHSALLCSIDLDIWN